VCIPPPRLTIVIHLLTRDLINQIVVFRVSLGVKVHVSVRTMQMSTCPIAPASDIFFAHRGPGSAVWGSRTTSNTPLQTPSLYTSNFPNRHIWSALNRSSDLSPYPSPYLHEKISQRSKVIFLSMGHSFGLPFDLEVVLSPEPFTAGHPWRQGVRHFVQFCFCQSQEE